MKKIQLLLLSILLFLGGNVTAHNGMGRQEQNTTTTDAGVSAILAPKGIVTASADPLIIIENTGSTVLNSVYVFYKIDNGAENRIVWTGYLETNQRTMLSLSTISGYTAGAHTFTARTALPNGITDGNTANDALSSNFIFTSDVSTTDVGISGIAAPNGILTAASMVPSITLKNFGTNTLTSAIIFYKLDNDIEFSQSWTGRLGTNETETVALPIVTGYAEGVHTFTVRVTSPNGRTDSDETNDSATSNFTFTHSTATTDAGILLILDPFGTVTTASVTPVVLLANYGTNTLTSVTIFYKLDNGEEASQTWTGNLAADETDLVVLPIITGYSAGSHTFTVRTASPNGITDNNTTNDTDVSDFAFRPFITTMDAGISAIAAPSGTIKTASVTPSVTLKNFGINPLTLVNIYYKIDNGEEIGQAWAGRLATNNTTTVVLNPASGYSSGVHTFIVRTVFPNSTEDEFIDNDADTSFFFYIPASSKTDAGISTITTPSGSITTGSVTPSVILKNFGSNTLTSATIFYKVDDGLEFNKTWRGRLAQNESTSISLPEVKDYSVAKHILTIRTEAPNDTLDDNITNDTARANFIYAPLELTTDAGILEIIAPVDIVEESALLPIVILRNFGTQTLTSVTIYYSIDNSPEYTMVWSGTLEAHANIGVILAALTNYDFGEHVFKVRTTLPNDISDFNTANDTLSSQFTYGFYVAQPDNRKVNDKKTGTYSSLAVFPNPAKHHIQCVFNAISDGEHELSLFDATGKCVLIERKTLGKGANQVDMTLNNLPKGLYLLKIQKNKEVLTQKVIIE